MPATMSFSGTPASSSAIVDAQTEPIEVEPFEPIASETCRIAYGNSSRVGQHRHQRPLGERAVADLAPLGRADPAGLAGRVRRHVVVVHVALGALRVERVDHLLHPEHVQRGDAQDLGLAALEQRRAVHPRQHARLGGQLPDVGQAAAVDAQAVADDPLPDQLLGQRAERAADLLLPALELAASRSVASGLDPVGLGLALLLARDRQRLGQLVADLGWPRPRRCRRLVVGEERELAGLLGRVRGDLLLRLARGP